MGLGGGGRPALAAAQGAHRVEWAGVAPVGSTRALLGVSLSVGDAAAAIDRLDRAIGTGECLKVAFANAHTINLARRSEPLRRALQSFHVLNDGLGVDIGSRIIFGRPFPANLNGTDFVPAYLARARQPLRIFLLGAAPDVVRDAAEVLRRGHPRHSVVGQHHGFIGTPDDDRVCGLIRAARADIVLVGMGNPLQELWIDRNAAASGAKLLVGVGALFDFLAQRVPRAPKLVRMARCEWAFRLLCEPRRLWRRYLLGNASFIASVLRERGRGLVRSA